MRWNIWTGLTHGRSFRPIRRVCCRVRLLRWPRRCCCLSSLLPSKSSAKSERAAGGRRNSADRAADELKALEEFAREEKDPEIEKLVSELKQAIEEMKEPGVDLREALAKLFAECSRSLSSNSRNTTSARLMRTCSRSDKPSPWRRLSPKRAKRLASNQFEESRRRAGKAGATAARSPDRESDQRKARRPCSPDAGFRVQLAQRGGRRSIEGPGG